MSLDDAIVALLWPGGVVMYPTETVYGIGGRASDSLAAHRVAALKGRGLQPLVVLIGALPPLTGLAAELAQLWPAPLTLIVPAPDFVAPEVRAADGTVGLRWSPHPICQALVDAVGPITSTSANAHGLAPPSSADEVTLPVDARIDAGTLPPARPSTLVHVGRRVILREGDMAELIRPLLGS